MVLFFLVFWFFWFFVFFWFLFFSLLFVMQKIFVCWSNVCQRVEFKVCLDWHAFYVHFAHARGPLFWKKKGSVGSYRCTPQNKKLHQSPPFVHKHRRGSFHSLPFLVKAVILSFLIIDPQHEVVVLHPKWLNEFYYTPPPKKKSLT